MGKKLQGNMKAVLYHADARFGRRHGPDIYKHLIQELRKNLHSFGVPLIHVTIEDHEGWGDYNHFYKVEDVNHVIYNREKCLLEFLRNDAEDDTVYWFCEPDFRMLNEFPPLTTDLAMLYRLDSMPMTPAWRLAKKTALPIFEESFKHFDLNQIEWHGDSPAWQEMYRQFGSPVCAKNESKIVEWNGLSVELRPYGWYASRSKCRYSGQWKGGSKMQIVTQEYRDYLKTL